MRNRCWRRMLKRLAMDSALRVRAVVRSRARRRSARRRRCTAAKNAHRTCMVDTRRRSIGRALAVQAGDRIASASRAVQATGAAVRLRIDGRSNHDRGARGNRQQCPANHCFTPSIVGEARLTLEKRPIFRVLIPSSFILDGLPFGRDGPFLKPVAALLAEANDRNENPAVRGLVTRRRVPANART